MENKTGKPLVWAHRGASAYRPENTLGAFSLAAAQGADGVELDVQLTKDGELVVIHDETIDRVSSGKGYVKDYTLKELKGFRFNRNHPECGDEGSLRIPTLREVYELLRPLGMTVNVELKTGIVQYEGIEEKALALAAEMEMEDRVIYSSFYHPSLLEIKKRKPDALTGLLYSDGWIDAASYGRDTVMADALHPALYHMQDEGLMEEARFHGLKVHVWTVNEESHMEMLMKMGVDAIITNHPDVCRKVVDRA